MINDDKDLYPPLEMPPLFITKTELEHGTFSQEQLDSIKLKCAMSGGLTLEWKNRLTEICSKLNQRALQQIVNEKIVYASDYAAKEISRRKTNGMK